MKKLLLLLALVHSTAFAEESTFFAELPKIKAQPQAISLGDSWANLKLINFGVKSWEGYVSFRLNPSLEAGRDFVTITDALGKTWTITGSSPSEFLRLLVPVTLTATTDSSQVSKLSLENIVYEPTRVHFMSPSPVSGKFSDSRFVIAEAPNDFPGAGIQLSYRAKFFDNFYAGTDCARITIQSSTRIDEITAQNPYANLEPAQGTVTLRADPSCQSSRLAKPESADADFTLTTVSEKLVELH